MANAVQPGIYTPQVNAQEALPRRVMPQAPNTSIASGLKSVGDALGEAGQSYLEAQAATYSAKTLSGVQQSWQQKFQDHKQNATDGADNFTPNVLKDYDADVADALKTAPSGLAKRFLGDRLTAFRNQLANQSLSFEAGERSAYSINVAKQSVDAAGNEVLTNPNVFGVRLAERKALIDAMPLDADTKRKLNDYAQSSLAKTAVMGQIEADPYGTLKDLTSSSPQSLAVRALDPDTRLQLINHSDTVFRQRVADAERLQRLQDKQEADNHDNLFKDGVKLSANSQLTPAWIEKNRDTLTPQEYKYFYDQVGGAGGKGSTDITTYADLRGKATAGQDVSVEAREQLTQGRLSLPDYNKIMEETEKNHPSQVKLGVQYLTTLSGHSELNPSPATAQVKAAMLDEFSQWTGQHKDATPDQIHKAYVQIGNDHQLANRAVQVFQLPIPKYMVGNQAKPNIDATEAATVKAFRDNKIDREEFDRQAGIVKRWRDLFAAPPAAEAPKK